MRHVSSSALWLALLVPAPQPRISMVPSPAEPGGAVARTAGREFPLLVLRGDEASAELQAIALDPDTGEPRPRPIRAVALKNRRKSLRLGPYVDAGGDLNGDGLGEILLSCGDERGVKILDGRSGELQRWLQTGPRSHVRAVVRLSATDGAFAALVESADGWMLARPDTDSPQVLSTTARAAGMTVRAESLDVATGYFLFEANERSQAVAWYGMGDDIRGAIDIQRPGRSCHGSIAVVSDDDGAVKRVYAGYPDAVISRYGNGSIVAWAPDGGVLWERLGSSNDIGFGARMVLLEDQDGDDEPDLVVTAPWAGSRDNAPRLDVLSGRTGRTIRSIHLGCIGFSLEDDCGRVGDLDGDGTSEIRCVTLDTDSEPTLLKTLLVDIKSLRLLELSSESL